MNIKGKLIALMPIQTGNSSNGHWKKQDIIIETDSQYPKKICVSIWGDKINESQLQIGNNLDISIELESRAFNNKWYTDVKAWKMEVSNKDTFQKAPLALNANFENFENETDEDVLPF
jgi:ribonuclease HI